MTPVPPDPTLAGMSARSAAQAEELAPIGTSLTQSQAAATVAGEVHAILGENIQSPSTIQLSQPSKFLQTNIVDLTEDISPDRPSREPEPSTLRHQHSEGVGAGPFTATANDGTTTGASASKEGSKKADTAQYFSIGSPRNNSAAAPGENSSSSNPVSRNPSSAASVPMSPSSGNGSSTSAKHGTSVVDMFAALDPSPQQTKVSSGFSTKSSTKSGAGSGCDHGPAPRTVEDTNLDDLLQPKKPSLLSNDPFASGSSPEDDIFAVKKPNEPKDQGAVAAVRSSAPGSTHAADGGTEVDAKSGPAAAVAGGAPISSSTPPGGAPGVVPGASAPAVFTPAAPPVPVAATAADSTSPKMQQAVHTPGPPVVAVAQEPSREVINTPGAPPPGPTSMPAAPPLVDETKAPESQGAPPPPPPPPPANPKGTGTPVPPRAASATATPAPVDPWRRVHEVQEEKQVVVDSLQQAIQQLTAENETLRQSLNQQSGATPPSGNQSALLPKFFDKISEILDDDPLPAIPPASATSNASAPPPEPPAFIAAFVNFYGNLRSGLATSATNIMQAATLPDADAVEEPPQLMTSPASTTTNSNARGGPAVARQPGAASHGGASTAATSATNMKQGLKQAPPPPSEFKKMEVPAPPAEFKPAPRPPAPPPREELQQAGVVKMLPGGPIAGGAEVGAVGVLAEVQNHSPEERIELPPAAPASSSTGSKGPVV
ncbi:unnamed protein product [Amoebophrya sp. A120]|nr:unnamed protein product [Amoebophrya sp. A120]|eukprot:GSA120T00008174001.1